jgi:hypothetical protein
MRSAARSSRDRPVRAGVELTGLEQQQLDVVPARAARQRVEEAVVALRLAYFDVFWLFAMLGLAMVPLVLLMKRSVAEKGAHLAAE